MEGVGNSRPERQGCLGSGSRWGNRASRHRLGLGNWKGPHWVWRNNRIRSFKLPPLLLLRLSQQSSVSWYSDDWNTTIPSLFASLWPWPSWGDPWTEEYSPFEGLFPPCLPLPTECWNWGKNWREKEGRKFERENVRNSKDKLGGKWTFVSIFPSFFLKNPIREGNLLKSPIYLL